MKGRAISWDAEELAFIEARAQWPRPELLAALHFRFDRTDVSLVNLNALCERQGWLTGRPGHFVKGQVSHNAGKKGIRYAGSEKGWFKPGSRPHTWRGAGHETIDNKDGYVWMIVDQVNPHTGAATRRVMKHRWLWEQAHGPVPDGMRLKCLDGDKTNTDPSNWEAIPLALAPRLNGRFGRGYDTAPPEVKPTIMAIAKLEHAARQARKERL
jgi:hypothetical protein